MKVAVISDTHDHVWNFEKVLNDIKGKVQTVIHCGDIVAPFSMSMLSSANLPTYVFFGNNDGDLSGLIEKSGDNVTWIPERIEYGEVELDGKKIAFCHYPKMGEFLANSGKYDAVFHGHTHNSRNEKRGETLLLNPGAICGIQDGKPGVASYAIYDTSENTAEIFEIK